MTKYLRVSKTALVDMTAYLGDFVSIAIWGPLHFIIMFFIWGIIYQYNPGSEESFGYSLTDILSYSLIVTIISESLALYKVAWRLQDDNLEGTLTIYLCKPVDYISFRLFEMIPFSIVSFALSLPIVLLLFNLMKIHLVINLIILVGFVCSLIVGYLIMFFLFVLVGMSTFKIRNIWPVRAFFMAIMEILGGELIPVDLLPSPIDKIAKILPFYLLNWIPAQWMLGRITPVELITSIVYGLMWVFLLFFSVRFLWKRALASFESSGG